MQPLRGVGFEGWVNAPRYGAVGTALVVLHSSESAQDSPNLQKLVESEHNSQPEFRDGKRIVKGSKGRWTRK